MIFEKCLHFKRVLSLSESFLVILFVYSQTSLQSGQYIAFKNGTQKPPPLLAVAFAVLLENSCSPDVAWRILEDGTAACAYQWIIRGVQEVGKHREANLGAEPEPCVCA